MALSRPTTTSYKDGLSQGKPAFSDPQPLPEINWGSVDRLVNNEVRTVGPAIAQAEERVLSRLTNFPSSTAPTVEPDSDVRLFARQQSIQQVLLHIGGFINNLASHPRGREIAIYAIEQIVECASPGHRAGLQMFLQLYATGSYHPQVIGLNHQKNEFVYRDFNEVLEDVIQHGLTVDEPLFMGVPNSRFVPEYDSDILSDEEGFTPVSSSAHTIRRNVSTRIAVVKDYFTGARLGATYLFKHIQVYKTTQEQIKHFLPMLSMMFRYPIAGHIFDDREGLLALCGEIKRRLNRENRTTIEVDPKSQMRMRMRDVLGSIVDKAGLWCVENGGREFHDEMWEQDFGAGILRNMVVEDNAEPLFLDETRSRARTGTPAAATEARASVPSPISISPPLYEVRSENDLIARSRVLRSEFYMESIRNVPDMQDVFDEDEDGFSESDDTDTIPGLAPFSVHAPLYEVTPAYLHQQELRRRSYQVSNRLPRQQGEMMKIGSGTVATESTVELLRELQQDLKKSILLEEEHTEPMPSLDLLLNMANNVIIKQETVETPVVRPSPWALPNDIVPLPNSLMPQQAPRAGRGHFNIMQWLNKRRAAASAMILRPSTDMVLWRKPESRPERIFEAELVPDELPPLDINFKGIYDSPSPEKKEKTVGVVDRVRGFFQKLAMRAALIAPLMGIAGDMSKYENHSEENRAPITAASAVEVPVQAEASAGADVSAISSADVVIPDTAAADDGALADTATLRVVVSEKGSSLSGVLYKHIAQQAAMRLESKHGITMGEKELVAKLQHGLIGPRHAYELVDHVLSQPSNAAFKKTLKSVDLVHVGDALNVGIGDSVVNGEVDKLVSHVVSKSGEKSGGFFHKVKSFFAGLGGGK